MGKLIAAFIDARGYRIILAVQIKSSYDNRPAFVKLLIKNGCNLISSDSVQSLPLYYFFFGLRLLTRFTPRVSLGSMQNRIRDHLKGMDQRPPRDHTNQSSLIGYRHRADVFFQHEVSNHGNLFAPVGRVDR